MTTKVKSFENNFASILFPPFAHPALISPEHFMEANSVINIINSFSSLLGPVLGGMLYSAYGLEPVLWVCVACFVLSAVMELFIQIPFVRQDYLPCPQ